MTNFVKFYKDQTLAIISEFRNLYIKNLPIYRRGLPVLLRGLEIGMAHGYFLIGPFYVFGPLRNSNNALLIGLLSSVGLIFILTVALTIYGIVSFGKVNLYMNLGYLIRKQAVECRITDGYRLTDFWERGDWEPVYGYEESRWCLRRFKNDPLKSSWRKFTSGFFIGSVGGSIVAYTLLANVDLFV